MNTIMPLIKNQACHENILECMNIHAEETIKNLSPAILKVLNLLIKQCFKFRINSPSQSSMGSWLGYTRQTINTLIDKLCKLGLIIKKYRHRTTCIYSINSIFNNLVIASKLRHILPALWLPYSLTCYYASDEHLRSNLTPLKVINKPVIYNSEGLLNVKRYPTKRIALKLSQSVQNGWSDLLKKIVNGEIRNMDMISPAIRNFRSLALTLRGQIELMPYPDEVINQADSILSASSMKIDNPIAYLRKICQRICSDSQIIPKWSAISELLQYYKLPQSEPLLKSPEIIKPYPLRVSAPVRQVKKALKREVGKFTPWKPSTPEFTKRCEINHEHELQVLRSEKALENLKRSVEFFGYEKAHSLYNRMINQHEECLKNNHKNSIFSLKNELMDRVLNL